MVVLLLLEGEAAAAAAAAAAARIIVGSPNKSIDSPFGCFVSSAGSGFKIPLGLRFPATPGCFGMTSWASLLSYKTPFGCVFCRLGLRL